MLLLFVCFRKTDSKKLKNVKDQYVKSVKKKKGKSCSGAKTVKNYIYHEQLSFFKVTMGMRETESSFEVGYDKSPGEPDDTDTCKAAEGGGPKLSDSKSAPKKKK